MTPGADTLVGTSLPIRCLHQGLMTLHNPDSLAKGITIVLELNYTIVVYLS